MPGGQERGNARVQDGCSEIQEGGIIEACQRGEAVRRNGEI